LGDLNGLFADLNVSLVDSYYLDKDNAPYSIYKYYSHWTDNNSFAVDRDLDTKEFYLSEKPYGPFDEFELCLESCMESVFKMRSYSVVYSLYSNYFGLGSTMGKIKWRITFEFSYATRGFLELSAIYDYKNVNLCLLFD
jgi:hypothetical protein